MKKRNTLTSVGKMYKWCIDEQRFWGKGLGRFAIFVLLAMVATTVALAALPFVMTAVLILLMIIFFGIRFVEFMSSDDAYSETVRVCGHGVGSCIFLGAAINLVAGWIFWLIVVYKVHVLSHYVFLELEAIKWIQLFLVFSASCFLISFPRMCQYLGDFTDTDIGVMKRKNDTIRVIDDVVDVIDCALLIAGQAVFMKLAPRWRGHVTMGFETWRFIQLLALVLLGITLIKITSRLIVYVVEYFYGDWKHVVYYTKGLRTSANFVFISTLLLVVWTKIVQPRFKRAAVASDRKMEFITWAFVCLSIASGLWAVKKCIVLLWTAHAVYDRFHDKIAAAAKQFYFLLQLRDDTASDPKEEIATPDSLHLWNKIGGMINIGHPKSSSAQGNANDQDNKSSNKPGENSLLPEQTTTLPNHQLQRLTVDFHNIENKLKEGDTTIATLFANYYGRKDVPKISSPTDLEGAIKDIYKYSTLTLEEAEVLYNQIKQDDENECVNAQNFEKWVVKAYRNCWELSNTIVGAKEVANYLDKLLTGLVLPLVVLIWLLVTKIATEKLLILLTSPILAATFIFGDTCKGIFHGIIFAFVMHLFDVGDICIIDDTQMEVKLIGIWKTTFHNVETDEKIIYQNSILADKLIIKHKGGLNLNDSVDYCVPIHTWTPTTFYNLKDEIDEYIENNSGRYQKHALGVLVKQVGDENVKISVHFKHKTDDQNMFYYKGLKKHNKCRADMVMKVKEIIDAKNKTKQD